MVIKKVWFASHVTPGTVFFWRCQSGNSYLEFDCAGTQKKMYADDKQYLIIVKPVRKGEHEEKPPYA